MPDTYTDQGGFRQYPPPYDGAIDRPCTNCKAEVGERCVNPLNGKPKHIPCIIRAKAVSA